ncbi:hypothetical protein MKW92_027573, partial [Papaver armeniacum]
KALNSIFQQWNISAASLWNISGEPCSGAAIDRTGIEDNPNLNPGIKCSCGTTNRSTCHITQLRVYAMNIRGVIPKELADLTSLTYLKLDQNFLTGRIPAFHGSLSLLETLSLSINSLSGTVPKELGNLRNLKILVFGSNNLSGSLPPQLGSLTNLQQIYIDSAGVGGDIPLTFASLVNIETIIFVLRFAETEYDDPSSLTWKSLGRRVFDIYLQGDRRVKDFDIRKEAGGASNRAVQRDFTFPVSQNCIEIHLFWAGKGSCCIPYQGSYGPSISAILITPDFEPTVSNLPPTAPEKSKIGLIVGIVVSVAVLSCISIFAVFYCGRKVSDVDEEEELLGIENKPNTFTYAELRNATAAFNSANKLGEGGFGSVYKGTLSDGRAVAVKQLSVTSRQGKIQFVAEISTISSVQHRNLVKLYGCCIEGTNRLLVYEYLEHRSLDQALF